MMFFQFMLDFDKLMSPLTEDRDDYRKIADKTGRHWETKQTIPIIFFFLLDH